MNKQASRIPNTVPRKSESARRLIVISGGFEYNPAPVAIKLPIISQMRLARIKEKQSFVAFLRSKLKCELELLRGDLMKGATIEDGPIRAWLEHQFIVDRGRKRKTRIQLRVY